MNEFSKRIEELSPQKRELLKLFLEKQGLTGNAGDTYVGPRNEIERTLADIWSSVLGIEKVGIHDNFFEIGGDSIQGIQIIAKANEAGLLLTNSQLFEHLTIAKLGAVVKKADPEHENDRPVSGTAPLAPIQRWFFASNLESRAQGRSFLLELPAGWSRAALEGALEHIWRHHDALRIVFQPGQPFPRQEIREADQLPPQPEYIDLMELGEAAETAIRAHAEELRNRLNIWTGPLFQTAFFNLGTEVPGRLLITAHPLIVDDYSFLILIEDLETAYRQIVAGQSASLPSKTVSWKAWAEHQRDLSHPDRLRPELDQWRELVTKAEGVETVTKERVAGLPIETHLDKTITRGLFKQVLSAKHTRIQELVLAVMIGALAEVTGDAAHELLILGHGRDAADDRYHPYRTVGWFHSFFPVTFKAEPGDSIDRVLEQVRSKMQQVPNQGKNYLLIHYGSIGWREAEPIQSKEPPGIYFNFLGHLDEKNRDRILFKRAAQEIGRDENPVTAHAGLAMTAWIEDGGLHFLWSFDKRAFSRETVNALAEKCRRSLRKLHDAMSYVT